MKRSSRRYKLKIVKETSGGSGCTCCPVNGEPCHCGGSSLGSTYYRIWDTKKKKFTRHHNTSYYGILLDKEEGMEKVRELNIK